MEITLTPEETAGLAKWVEFQAQHGMTQAGTVEDFVLFNLRMWAAQGQSILDREEKEDIIAGVAAASPETKATLLAAGRAIRTQPVPVIELESMK